MSTIFLRKRHLHIKFLLHITIAVIGMISVPLHILFSPNPSISITKFTIHSNIIVIIVFIVSAFILLTKKKENRILDLCKNAALIYMIVVLTTYHFILSSGGEYSGIRIMTNFTLHYFIPMLILLNWIIFEEKKWYSFKTIAFWLAFPIIYGAISLLRGMYDGFYPYFFLNPNSPIPDGVGSYLNVSFVIAGFTFVYCTIGFLLIIINRGILRLQRTKQLRGSKR
ncbi:Pr6Pr family membrane protein [Oceanobacillus sp. CFH 90083]|uniref:Pr6Pr family membrane protein n=1 Tax=Oceanobacillus sp. CFH 90083 TaxID=2592336 RepID=UPI00128CFAA6|nr:Pr6Pr family membrane protein [Oceanobacillus sp. CFH 90083]